MTINDLLLNEKRKEKLAAKEAEDERKWAEESYEAQWEYEIEKLLEKE